MHHIGKWKKHGLRGRSCAEEADASFRVIINWLSMLRAQRLLGICYKDGCHANVWLAIWTLFRHQLLGQLLKLMRLEDKLKEFLSTRFRRQFCLPIMFHVLHCLNLAPISQPSVMVVLFHFWSANSAQSTPLSHAPVYPECILIKLSCCNKMVNESKGESSKQA